MVNVKRACTCPDPYKVNKSCPWARFPDHKRELVDYVALRKGDMVRVRWQSFYLTVQIGRVIGIRPRSDSPLMITVALPGGNILSTEKSYARAVPVKWHNLPSHSFFEGDPRLEKIPTFPYLRKK